MSWRRHASLVKAAWVFSCLAASLTAQQLPERDPAPASLLRANAQQRADWASEWLRSNDPLRVAWGAWLARQDRQTALVPLLLERVREYQPTGESWSQTVERDRHDTLLVVLDALIGLDATVPVDEARKLYPEFAAQAIILLVRSPEAAQPALLDIFQDAKTNGTWLAAGNVLLKTNTPGFAALVLGRFTQHLTVSVFDPGRGGGFGSGGSECGSWSRTPKTDWPSVGLYHLTQFPERMPGLTATLLAGGETTVYYWRVETGNYDNLPDSPSAHNDGNRDQYRAQYLAKLMRTAFPRISLDPYPQITIEWKDAAGYREQLLAAVAEQRTEFRRALASLQESGQVLAPAETATLKPRLEIVIRDERADQSSPLPVVLANDGPVAVRVAFTKPLD